MPDRSDVLATLRGLLRPRTRFRNVAASKIDINLYSVVRFSLRYEDYMLKAFGDETRRRNWFAMRAQLFKASLVASIDRQTLAPRQVFVLMDVSDVDLWQEHLDLPAPYTPVFTSAADAFDEVARRITGDRRKNVMISRLDSDDAISSRYFEKLADAARTSWRLGRAQEYVVACNGFFTDLKNIQEIYYNCSPFISLYVRRYRGENIFDGDHTHILERSPQMLDTVRWMQIIHGSNIDNRIYKESKFAPEDERKMEIGELNKVKAAWPPGFPPKLVAQAKLVREEWKQTVRAYEAAAAEIQEARAEHS